MSKLRVNQLSPNDDSTTINVADIISKDSLTSYGDNEGDSLIAVQLDAAGAAQRTQHQKNADQITVEDFGAIGDGTLHPLSERFSTLVSAQAKYPHVTSLTQSIDWAAIQAAVNYSATTGAGIKLLARYIVNAPIKIATAGVQLMGCRTWSFGARISTASDYNDLVFDISATCSLSNFKIKGPTTAQTSNVLVSVTDTNAVRMDGMFFESGYRQVLLKGTSFYISIDNSDFYGSLYSALETSSSTYPGIDFIMSHCRFLAATGAYVVCLNGLGSAVMSNVQASVNKVTQCTLYFGTPAGGFGGCQMSNCVWENDGDISSSAIASVYINGSSSSKWKSIWFDNCIITGNAVPAVLMFWHTGVKFSNCGLSSTAAAGVVYFNASGQTAGTCFDNCEWSTNGSNAPVRFGAVTKGDVTLTNCSYIGSNSFVDVASTAYASITQVNVMNCFLGAGSSPVTKTSDGYWPNGQILTTGHQLGGFTKVTATISTDASGNASVAHYVYNAQKRVALLTAVAKGSSGEAVGASTATLKVDGGSLYVVGGPTSGKVRITALFNEAEDSGW